MYSITHYENVAQVRVRKQDDTLDEFAFILDSDKSWESGTPTLGNEKWETIFRTIATELVDNGDIDEDDSLFILLTSWDGDCATIISANVNKSWEGDWRVYIEKAYIPE